MTPAYPPLIAEEIEKKEADLLPPLSMEEREKKASTLNLYPLICFFSARSERKGGER